MKMLKKILKTALISVCFCQVLVCGAGADEGDKSSADFYEGKADVEKITAMVERMEQECAVSHKDEQNTYYDRACLDKIAADLGIKIKHPKGKIED